MGHGDAPRRLLRRQGRRRGLVRAAPLEFVKAAHPALHPGRCAELVGSMAAVVGMIGELHPRWVQKYELGTAPVVFELELPALLARLSRPMPRCRASRP
jgi:phenylalanyl-tRNA synthetase beta chain